MPLREAKRKPARIQVDADARVIAIEGFRPPMGQLVERGMYFKLGDPLVRAWPAYFAVVVPVNELEREITRGNSGK